MFKSSESRVSKLSEGPVLLVSTQLLVSMDSLFSEVSLISVSLCD